MKSHSSFVRLSVRIAALALAGLIASLTAACGQSGPLYLPNKPPAETVNSAPAPAPAPTPAGQNTQSPQNSSR